MRFGQGTPSDIFSWFTRSSRAQWLGFFLAGDGHYNNLMNAVLDKAEIFDTISGYHIDLFVFDTGQQIQLQGSGYDVTVDATPLTPLQQNYEYFPPDLRERHLLVSGIGHVNLTAAKKRNMVKMTGRATNELTEFLGLGIDDIPSLVLVHKSFNFLTRQPVLVLRTRGQPDADFLIEFLRSIRKLLETQRKANADLVALARHHDPAGALDIEIDRSQAARHHIQRQAAFLVKTVGEHGFIANERQIVENVLAASVPRDGIEHALAGSGLSAERIAELEVSDPRVRNVCASLLKSRQRLDRVAAAGEQYALQVEGGLEEFQALLERFDRKISYQIASDQVLSFFKFTTSALKKAKQLVQLISAVKNGGTHLLG